ncbi:hypothetical protein MBRA_05744 [Methylobacterium brachiatum]|jgi:hypothetical protein|nr:hypothetical protein MBRA_05744 [Methylobacterium brachiatum]
MPVRAMRGTIPRARHSWRRGLASQALSACSLSGRRRGRPRRPLRTDGMASRVAAIITVSCRLAPLRQTPSGVPRASVTRWRFVPGLPRSVGFGPVAAPLFGRDSRAVQASPAPADLTRRVQALQQHVMQAAPNARRLPIPQPPPATHAGAAAHLGRQHFPRQPRAQHEQDARECGPVLNWTTPALRTRPRRRKERSDLIPEIIGEKRSDHAKPTLKTPLGAVLLGALRRCRRRLNKLCSDKGHDHRRCRRECQARSITPRIAQCGIETSESLGRYH